MVFAKFYKCKKRRLLFIIIIVPFIPLCLFSSFPPLVLRLFLYLFIFFLFKFFFLSFTYYLFIKATATATVNITTTTSLPDSGLLMSTWEHLVTNVMGSESWAAFFNLCSLTRKKIQIKGLRRKVCRSCMFRVNF